MDLQLTGERAIVTGGSAGIGFEAARRLAAEGVGSIVCSGDLGRARDAIAAMGDTGPGRLIPAVVELRDPPSVVTMVDGVEPGGVDILVNSGAEVSGNVAEDFARITDEFILRGVEDKFLRILRAALARERLRSRHQLPRAHRAGGRLHRGGRTQRRGGQPHQGTLDGVQPRRYRGERDRPLHDGDEGLPVPSQEDGRASRPDPGRASRADLRAHICWAPGHGGGDRLLRGVPRFPLSVALTGEVVALTGGVGESVYL